MVSVQSHQEASDARLANVENCPHISGKIKLIVIIHAIICFSSNLNLTNLSPAPPADPLDDEAAMAVDEVAVVGLGAMAITLFCSLKLLNLLCSWLHSHDIHLYNW